MLRRKMLISLAEVMADLEQSKYQVRFPTNRSDCMIDYVFRTVNGVSAFMVGSSTSGTNSRSGLWTTRLDPHDKSLACHRDL